jgi:hypothetical protein
MERPNPISVESLAILRGPYLAMNASKVVTALINGSHDLKAARPVIWIANKPNERPPSMAAVKPAT